MPKNRKCQCRVLGGCGAYRGVLLCGGGASRSARLRGLLLRELLLVEVLLPFLERDQPVAVHVKILERRVLLLRDVRVRLWFSKQNTRVTCGAGACHSRAGARHSSVAISERTFM
jgi:hypothetical protein